MNLGIKLDDLRKSNFNNLKHRLRVRSKNQAELEAFNTLTSKYRTTMDNINTIACRDLNEGLQITFNSHKLAGPCQDKLDMYLQDLDTLNIHLQAEQFINEYCKSISPSQITKMKKSFLSWHSTEVMLWDKKLEDIILAAMDKKHVEKCAIEFGIYNFTNLNIPAEDLLLLKGGKKMVLPLNMSIRERDARVSAELLEYAKRFRKYVENNKSAISDTNDFATWIDLAICSSTTSDARRFYSSLYNNFKNRHQDYPLYLDSNVHSLSKAQLSARLDYKDALWNEADKGRGLALLSSDQLRSAEDKCITSLGGKPYSGSQADLENNILEQISSFYEVLDGQQIWFLDNMFGNLKEIPNDCIVPFLNLKSKLHKLSEEDIKNKNFGKLSFRPVIDQSRWILNKASRSFMLLIASINSKLKETPPLSQYDSILPKNGAEVAGHIKNFKYASNNSIKSIVSADLSDAYSNIKLLDLELALEKAAEILDLEAWKLELLISLARLILRNNYVETSKGIFKLTEVLAMGNSSSGACLDLVGLTAEFTKLASSTSAPTPLPSLYFRYLDDTKAILELSTKEETSSAIINIGKMFPPSIPINIDLFNVVASFLDIVTIRKLSTDSMVTIQKKNFSSPPTYIPYASSHPSIYKSSALKSEMIRARRTCSKPEFVALMDKMLKRELYTLGHKNAHSDMCKFASWIATNYDSNFVKIQKEEEEQDGDDTASKVYGATSKMEKYSKTHYIVKNIIKQSLGSCNASLPMVVPTVKLKELLHSRRRYMAKLKK